MALIDLAKLAKDLTVLTHYHFWTLADPEHRLKNAEVNSEPFKALQELIGSNPQDYDALDEFLESSAGVTTLTIDLEASDERPFNTELCLEPSDKPINYQDILYMITQYYHPDDGDDWINTIEVDPTHSKLIISLTR